MTTPPTESCDMTTAREQELLDMLKQKDELIEQQAVLVKALSMMLHESVTKYFKPLPYPYEGPPTSAPYWQIPPATCTGTP